MIQRKIHLNNFIFVLKIELLSFCHINKIVININNIVEYIKKYYFFDKGNWAFEEYRDNRVFNEVKNELITINFFGFRMSCGFSIYI